MHKLKNPESLGILKRKFGGMSHILRI